MVVRAARAWRLAGSGLFNPKVRERRQFVENPAALLPVRSHAPTACHPPPAVDGGRNYKLLTAQAARLSTRRLTSFTAFGEFASKRQNGAFVQYAISLNAEGGRQDRCGRKRCALTLIFEVCVWLSYRLHSLSRSATITWAALHAQFGAGFQAMRHFRPEFADARQLALAVYPEARVDVERSEPFLDQGCPPPSSLAGGWRFHTGDPRHEHRCTLGSNRPLAEKSGISWLARVGPNGLGGR